MAIYSIVGQIGSGKSYFQLKFALEMANQKEKALVCNFSLNRIALRKYAIAAKLPWIIHLLDYGGITEIHAPKDLQVLMLSNSVVCLDEAGILLNSRSWKNTPKAFLADLCQSRKKATDLIWVAQFSEQVDSQMRMLTQYWIKADGLTYYHKPTKLPRLYYQRFYFMDADRYNRFHLKPVSHLKARLAFAYRYHGGFLSPTEKILFDCFDTSTMLDRITGYAKHESLEYCRLVDRPKISLQGKFEARAELLECSDFQPSSLCLAGYR